MWKLSLLLCLSLFLSGCASIDISGVWPHNPTDLNEYLVHSDEKIGFNRARIERLEALLMFKCECDSECRELMEPHLEPCE